MSRLEQISSRIRQRKVSAAVGVARAQACVTTPNDHEELSDKAIRAIAEGRADHAAGRTFTLDEIKREFGG